MTYVAATEGYVNMRIDHLTSRAGVSRQTFYELFKDKNDCFLAAYARAGELLLGRLQTELERTHWWQAPADGMRVLLRAIEAEPETAWLLFVEGLAGGERVRGHRGAIFDLFERSTEEFLDRAPKDGLTLDIPASAYIGAIRNVTIDHLLSNSADLLPGLVDDLTAWIRSYAAPANRPRWSSSARALLPPNESKDAPAPLLQRPEPLPRGRHNLPASVVARNHRERIIFATADAAMTNGYAEMTVTDIVEQARIANNVFYEHFTGKREAFLAAQQHTARETMSVCAHAFFSAKSWPEGMYEGVRALTIMSAREPALTHLRLVEPYAVGPEAIRHQDDLVASFALFVEGGYYISPETRELPQLFSKAIAAAVTEVIRHEVALKRSTDLPRHTPQLAYITIAPFTGAEKAAELVEGFKRRRV